MASDSRQFNEDTRIFAENDNVLRQNVQGQKPFKYYTRDFSKPQIQGLPEIGYQRYNGNVSKLDSRPQPTRLNEINDPLSSGVNAAFMGSEHVNLKNIDTHSELRWGGRLRCKKGQQLVTEMPQHRINFLDPSVPGDLTSGHVVPIDIDIVRGGGLSMPNYRALGHNVVQDSRFGINTRNERKLLMQKKN
uniref:Uncharacterized protein n=1 Tax=viral metagenome TaxID=1070528 RepID=A0A6C0KC60_9ZZZZ